MISYCSISFTLLQMASRGIEIFIDTLTGKRFSINVKASYTIAKVKQAIWESEGIHSSQQKLIFGAKTALG